MRVICFCSIFLIQVAAGVYENQGDYQVNDIVCSFGNISADNNRRSNARLSAVLHKPQGFKGTPIFADDRQVDASRDPDCQIRPDMTDRRGLAYKLLVRDLNKCGVAKKSVSAIARNASKTDSDDETLCK